MGMVATLDGATAVEGRSGPLGGPADKEVFRAVRGVADAILVGAGTVRAEEYGPVRLADAVVEARTAAGRDPAPPRLVVVTADVGLDPDARALREADTPPLVCTTEDAPDDAVAALAGVAEVRRFGRGRVDLAAALASLAADGVGVVVSEGGPTLNGALVAADLVDELCLTIAPIVAGGDSHRIVHGAPAGLRRHELVSLLTADGLLFGRWVRSDRR